MIDRLRRGGVVCAGGLTHTEVGDLEALFAITFSVEHRDLLGIALPAGPSWVDWRGALHHEDVRQSIRVRLDQPVEGIAFDVANGGFWPASWGVRPAARVAADGVARARLASVPTLVPLFGHRYLPAAPTTAPSPVFSVHQADVIYYGDDLLDWAARESGGPPDRPSQPRPEVPFWSHLADGAENAEL